MTTSGSYGFSINRDQIVRKALLDLKKIDGIDPIDPTVMSDCVFNLNLLVKQWQGRADFAPGLKVWTRKTGHLFLRAFTGQYNINSALAGWTNDDYDQTYTTTATAAAGTAVYVQSLSGVVVGDKVGIALDTGDLFWSTVDSLGTLIINLSTPLPSSSAAGNIVFSYTNTPIQPLLVETATLRDQYYTDTPLNLLQRRDYDFLPNKVSPNNYGDPTAILYENGLTTGNLFTDIAGSNDVSKHIVLTYMETIQDFVNNTDTPYYPQEWYLPLCWGLAKQCAPMFNAKWTPEMESNYNDALGIAKHKDPEIETRYFQCGE